MKKFVTTGAFVVLAVSLDMFFSYIGLPIVTMDLLLSPISISIIIWVCTPSFLDGEYIDWSQIGNLSTLNRLANIFIVFGLVALSVFLLYLGLSNPLKLFTGVRGAGHGYTLAITGIAILFFLISTLYVFVFKKNV